MVRLESYDKGMPCTERHKETVKTYINHIERQGVQYHVNIKDPKHDASIQKCKG